MNISLNHREILSFVEDIFQTVEESDFLATKQLIKNNENLINSYGNISLEKSSMNILHCRSNEYDWYPLDIAIMLNNIPMIRLLLHYGADESSKGMFKRERERGVAYCLYLWTVQPEEVRYRSVCQQISDLHTQIGEQSMKKSSTNKLTLDEIQVRICMRENTFESILFFRLVVFLLWLINNVIVKWNLLNNIPMTNVYWHYLKWKIIMNKQVEIRWWCRESLMASLLLFFSSLPLLGKRFN